MFRRLYNWTLRQAARPNAEPVLGLISFTESSCFPIPADVLFVPMVLARPDRAWRLALIASVTSVLGGIFGWWIGYVAFDAVAAPLLDFWGKREAFEALKSDTGWATVLLLLITSGATHLPPMKVVTILSGLVSFPLGWFILSAIVARGGRFFLLAWLLRRYGIGMVAFVERRFRWVAAGVTVLALLAWLLTQRG